MFKYKINSKPIKRFVSCEHATYPNEFPSLENKFNNVNITF